MVAIRLMPFSPFDTITRSCFPMRLQKAFTKEGSYSSFPFPCMVCYLSYAEKG